MPKGVSFSFNFSIKGDSAATERTVGDYYRISKNRIFMVPIEILGRKWYIETLHAQVN